MSIYEKLATVQQKLKAPKNQYNSFGKYNYRSCEDILEGIKPLLAEVKAIVSLNDTIEMIGDRFYVKAEATFIDTENGEKHTVSAYAREDHDKKGMDLAQVTGSVSSYARKYALNGLFCIDDTKDSDATNNHGKDQQQSNKAEKKKLPQDKVNELEQLRVRAMQTEAEFFANLSKMCKQQIKGYDDLAGVKNLDQVISTIDKALSKKELKEGAK
jgi:hypothetical protein